MAPIGTTSQYSWSCAGSAQAARLVADKSDATPPQQPAAVHSSRRRRGKQDFGATGSEFLDYAWLGIHDFAHDKEGARKNLRLIAHLADRPATCLVAVNHQGRHHRSAPDRSRKKMAVKLVVRGGEDVPINKAVLRSSYGLSHRADQVAAGRDDRFRVHAGHRRRRHHRLRGMLVGGPIYGAWYTASQQQDLTFLDLPAELRDRAREGLLPHAGRGTGRAAPRACTRRIPTVARDGIVIYGRDDMPDRFAYDVAKALDEQKAALQWSDMPISYNEEDRLEERRCPLRPAQQGALASAATWNRRGARG